MARIRIDTARWAVAAVFVALAAWRLAGAAGSWSDRLSVGAAALVGIVAVLLPVPGVSVVQALAALAALGGLLRADLTFAVIFLLVLLGPPAFLLSWELSGGPWPGSGREAEALARERRARWATIGIILAAAGGSATYRLLVAHRLEQTAALFIGIPTLLAILVVLAGTPETATGSICKAIAIALLMSGIFLGEGFICILMAAPLFFAIGVLIGLLVDASRRSFGKKAKNTAACLAGLVLLPLILEGVDERLSWPREETVTAGRDVAADPDEIARQLVRPPEFRTPLPVFLRLGFPRPTVRSGGLRPGERLTVHWSGGEGRPGDLVLEVIESRPGLLRVRAVADGSHIAHWLRWHDAEVRWSAIGAGRTRVTWTLRYRRDLDPAWYFGPWERYAVGLAAGYLIDTLATPR